MTPIRPGDQVLARGANGQLLQRRAVTAVVDGDDFPVVWVCPEDEWHAAREEQRDPQGFPWPAEDVQPLASEAAA